MKIGFTSTREGLSRYQRKMLVVELDKLQPTEVHYGMCEGGDDEFYDLVLLLRNEIKAIPSNCKIIGHPPINKNKYAHRDCDELREPKDYLVRNKDIVDETSMLIACPLGEEVLRSGTWATVREARRQQKEVIIIERENQNI